jgi:hypothetical protein
MQLTDEQLARDIVWLDGWCAPDDLADVTLSSVHRFKGQEAEIVRMADDFGLFCYPNTKPGLASRTSSTKKKPTSPTLR